MTSLRTVVTACAIALIPAFAASAAPTDAGAVLAQYGRLVHASYTDATAAAADLKRAVDRFLERPDEARLGAARRAWLAARDWYGQTEAFRFYGGPIDGEDGPEGRINAWPMDEAYVDGVVGSPEAGLINRPDVPITADSLSALNEKDGEENISTGWHAIEFMLWGQDLSADGPGQRPYTDFVDGRAPHADRRRAYLRVVTDLLIEDLTSVRDAWAPDADNYRRRFEADPANLARMISALGILSRGELAGERIEVALDSQSQEDEHSCFSDNTHRDVVANVRGIRNVWLGTFKRRDGSVVEGPSLHDLVHDKDAAIADQLDRDMAASLAAAEAIPAPFDQAILAGSAGRPKVEATVSRLKTQTTSIVAAAAALGIRRLNTTMPE
ncbi:MAG: iron-regulated protein [Rhodocyclaceae bacterium]|nr:iron-regulated protein [Rhodocyclaceae bacterium]